MVDNLKQEMNITSEDKQEEGATMIEYALLIALVAIVAVAGVRFLGQTISRQFSMIADSLISS